MEAGQKLASALREMVAEPSGTPMLDDIERQTRINKLRKQGCQTAVSNFNLKDGNDAFALLMMKSAKSQSVWDHQKITLDVQYIHVQEREEIDKETGEVNEKQRCSFITQDGGIFHSGAAIVADIMLSILETTLGQKKFDPPLSLTFEKVKSSPTTTYQTVSVDLDSIRLLQEKYCGDRIEGNSA